MTAPRLPPELERCIFEEAALTHRASISSLLRVAHRVHVWIEPMLYNVLTVDYAKVKRSPADFRDASFLASNVQHLNLSGPIPPAELQGLLGTCTSITSLAMWLSFPLTPSPELLPLLELLPSLRRLAVDITHLFGGPLRPSGFRSLTHLDILAAPFDEWRLYAAAGLHRMLALTHLAFRERFHPRVLRGALAHCPALRALGVVWGHGARRRRRAADVREGEVVDVRLFLLVCEDWVEDWARGAGMDVWARGEAFIARKRAGEIPESRLWAR
ncbi:hypothetical protein FB45DRAFT_949665 [Roridomyces roridus]|uniref:F-box domain-containing protein n=1 Tax=Roridomyces roridus TaxID=1738132 RepID=A0AAD7B0R9_9AGAR|nr:hypothetical protein FB45DRAFT_949665 [Roridomyces roridus]